MPGLSRPNEQHPVLVGDAGRLRHELVALFERDGELDAVRLDRAVGEVVVAGRELLPLQTYLWTTIAPVESLRSSGTLNQMQVTFAPSLSGR